MRVSIRGNMNQYYDTAPGTTSYYSVPVTGDTLATITEEEYNAIISG